MTATRIQARYTPLISFLPSLGLAVVLLVGGRDVINHSLSIGAFTAFYAYLLMLISPMRTLGYMLSAAQRATASGARIFEILDRAPEMTVPEDAPALPAGPGRISFRNVGLTFEGTNRPALHDVDLEIEAGRTVALVGAMGSGKTALISLLPRLYDATEGTVWIDGARVDEVQLASLRREIALVTDDPFLFSATVHDNIAYARPEATPRGGGAGPPAPPRPTASSRSAAQGLRHADRRTRADPLRRAAPADRHRPGDPGQPEDPRPRRRHLLRRCVHRAGDQAGPARGDGRRTTFVIAHRLSTIALADEIVVLENGTIAASRDARRAALQLSALPGDRGEGDARPGLHQPQAARG